MIWWTPKLSIKITILFFALSLLPMTIFNSIIFQYGHQIIEQATVNHLWAMTDLKKAELNRWVVNNQRSLQELAQHAGLRNLATQLNRQEVGSPSYQLSVIKIREVHFGSTQQEENNFLDLFLIRASDGRIMVSTNPSQEGTFRTDRSYFKFGKLRTYKQNIYHSRTRQEIVMTISTPVKGPTGQVEAVLAAYIDLAEMSRIMRQGRPLYETEETYLVNSANFFVTESRFETDYALKKAVHTSAVTHCLNHENGVGSYLGYYQKPVIGVYQWLPDKDLCIITEVSRAEALKPIYKFSLLFFGVGSLVTLIVSGLAIMVARTIIQPVKQLVTGTQQIGQGNLDYRIANTSQDEFGQLAQAFNDMAENLRQITASRNELNQEIQERSRIQQALLKSEITSQAILEAIPDLMFRMKSDGTFLDYKPVPNTKLYLPPEKFIGRKVNDVLPPVVAEQVMTAIEQTLQTKKIQIFEYQLLIDNLPTELEARIVISGENEILAIIRDITERKQAEAEFRDQKQFIQSVAETSPNVLYVYDIIAQCNRYANKEIYNMLGYTAAEIQKMGPAFIPSVIHPDDLVNIPHHLAKLEASKEGEVLELNYRMRHRNGEWRWFQGRETVFKRTEEGKLREVLGVIQDITTHKRTQEAIRCLNEELEERVLQRTRQLAQVNHQLRTEIMERQKVQERLLYLAMHDSLTHLPNRAFFLEQLAQALSRVNHQSNYNFAVLFLDCDRFKVVNDSLGHLVGDILLMEMARRLKNKMRQVDTLARFGGDEFIILMDGVQTSEDAINLAKRIQQEFSRPFEFNGREIFMTTSIGIVLGSSHYLQAEELLRDADTAMYQAKASGTSRCRVFDKRMHHQALQVMQLENELRRAIENKQFMIHYQPIISLNNGYLAGFEALVRWQHPTKGLISPTIFISLAEETDMIIPIGRWVLEQATRQLREWQERYTLPPTISISVNISAKQFSQPNLIDGIMKILAKTGLQTYHLKLELTETVLMEDINRVITVLSQLKQQKIQLSIDDFGTGYSSFSYLHRLPLDTLKIDQTFITRLNGKQEGLNIVQSIVSLAHSLGLDVVAEGLEKREQLMQLKHITCDYGQGFYFAKPLSREEVETLLARNELKQFCPEC